MKNIRIIPRLDIKGHNIVKPVQTEALRIVGNPKELACKYYKQGADEIIYMDIVASLYQRNIDFEFLKLVCDGIFIPFTVGGGIRTIKDINNALRSGADKIAINTHAINNPEFLSEAIKEFGAQCIVLSVDAKKRPNGTWEAYTDGGRERTGKDVIKWVSEAIDLGVGEILITSIDMDGTRNGYDISLIEHISSISTMPVIACGGASGPKSMLEAVNIGKADALSMASILHYDDFEIYALKKYLSNAGLNIRI